MNNVKIKSQSSGFQNDFPFVIFATWDVTIYLLAFLNTFTLVGRMTTFVCGIHSAGFITISLTSPVQWNVRSNQFFNQFFMYDLTPPRAISRQKMHSRKTTFSSMSFVDFLGNKCEFLDDKNQKTAQNPIRLCSLENLDPGEGFTYLQCDEETSRNDFKNT